MRLAVWVLVAGQSFVSLDDGGGFATSPDVLSTVRRRVLDVELPTSLQEPIVVTDSRVVASRLPLTVLGSTDATPRLQDGGVVYAGVLDGEFVTVTSPDTASLELTASGATLAVRLEPETSLRQVAPREFEVLLSGRPFYRLITNTPPDVNGLTVTVHAGMARAQFRFELVLTRVLFDGPLDSAAPNWGASLVWNPLRSQLVRFGGTLNGGDDPSTWVWSESSGWLDLNIPSPPPRRRSAMVWDAARGVVVLFGGSHHGVRLDDTWELTPSGWVERTPANHPLKRWGHGMAWDAVRQRVVLYGGFDGEGVRGRDTVYDDTWEWDGTDWVERPTAVNPGARDSHGLAWDENLNEVVLFGGWDNYRSYGDTWSWNGTRWLLRAAGGVPARCSTSLAWDSVAHELVLVGGWLPDMEPQLFFNDLWTFDGASWTPRGPMPEFVHRMALASHPTRGLVGFGGKNPEDVFGFMLARTATGFASMDTQRPSGPLISQGDRWAVFQGGHRWLAGGWSWHRRNSTPFVEAAFAENSNYGVIAVARSDAGTEVWEGGNGVLTFSSAPTGLVYDGVAGQAWLSLDDEQLWLRDAWGWVDAGPVQPGVGTLGAAGQGVLYFIDGGISSVDPSSGDVVAVTPAPFASGQRYTLMWDARREQLVASNTAEPYFAEWNGARWETLPTHRGVINWQSRGGSVSLTSTGELVSYEPLRLNGAVCSDARQCASGVCFDGLCCSTACGGAANCEACSRAAGGAIDGECTPIRYGVQVVCSHLEGCFESVCLAERSGCRAPYCPPDAGPPVEEPLIDAGPPKPVVRTRDAGMVVEELPMVRPCGCTSVPAGLGFVALLCLVARRRVRRVEPRHTS